MMNRFHTTLHFRSSPVSLMVTRLRSLLNQCQAPFNPKQSNSASLTIQTLKLSCFFFFFFTYRLPIQILFTASQEREYSFNLLCHVKRKLKPLVLNVKAQGYAINTAVTCKGPDGKEFELQLDKAAMRVIDFKQVHVNEKSLWELCVCNHGLYSFEYKWRLSEKCMQPGSDGSRVIMVQPEEGVVPAHEKVRCSLVFSPAGKMSLKGSNLTLSVSRSVLSQYCTF